MLLAIDAGNSNVTVGVFDSRNLVAQWRHETSSPPDRICRDLLAQIRRRRFNVNACAFGSVVPSLDRALVRAVESNLRCPVVIVTPKSRLGMRLKVRKPSQVGADRILNALAAYEMFKSSAVILDFGTATTFDCISDDGDYLGGAILLGPHLAANALHEHTAKLPLVRMAKPKRVIGKDTVECIEAGLYYGYLGMIEAVLRRTMAEMGGKPRLLATGGLARLFKKDLPKRIKIVDDLTLQGLRIAHARQASRV